MTPIRHYRWAGLDFMIDGDGTPVFIEANRSTHMLGEYLEFIGNDRPFSLTAGAMNRAGGVPCLLWRRDDPFPDADEDACFIAERLRPHLDAEPVVCDVEDNQEPRAELLTPRRANRSAGQHLSMVVWITVVLRAVRRDGHQPQLRMGRRSRQVEVVRAPGGGGLFCVPRAFAVESTEEVRRQIAANRDLFVKGFVLKPRVGWGGFGVQVGDAGDEPRPIGPNEILSERIISRSKAGAYSEIRVFVMDGVYLGGIRHTSRTPMTNYWQGGRPEPLDAETTAKLEPAALEAVRRLDAAAHAIHELPEAPVSELTRVVY